MREDRTEGDAGQALGAKLVGYVAPVLTELEKALDVRLVRTALGLLQVLLLLRHNRCGLLLSELGATCWGRSMRRRGRSTSESAVEPRLGP